MAFRFSAALAALAAAALAPFGAAADDASGSGVDWRIEAQLSETTEFDSNILLDAASDGPVYGATARLGVTATGKTKTSQTRLNATVAGALFGGSSDADDRDGVFPDISVGHSFRGKRVRVDSSASLNLRSASEAQLEDTGLTARGVTQLSARAATNVTLLADRRNSLTFGANAAITDFDRGVVTLVPTRTFGVTGAWRHAATETSALSLNTGYRYFEADDAQNTRSDAVDLTLSLNHRRTPRHTISLTGGLTGVFTRDDLTPGADFQIGFDGGASLDYKAKAWSAAMSVAQSVDASNEGQLSVFTRVSGGVNLNWNHATAFSLSAAATRRADLDGGNARNFFTLGPTLTRRLTKNASMSLGYAFSLDDESPQKVQTGHRVFLTLTTGLTLLP